MDKVYGKEIEELLKLELLEEHASPFPFGTIAPGAKRSVGEARGKGIRLTPRGRLLGNQVFLRFIG
jgi:hypothetical protein